MHPGSYRASWPFHGSNLPLGPRWLASLSQWVLHSKAATRRFLSERHIPSACSYQAQGAEEAMEIAPGLGSPVVVKPAAEREVQESCVPTATTMYVDLFIGPWWTASLA